MLCRDRYSGAGYTVRPSAARAHKRCGFGMRLAHGGSNRPPCVWHRELRGACAPSTLFPAGCGAGIGTVRYAYDFAACGRIHKVYVERVQVLQLLMQSCAVADSSNFIVVPFSTRTNP